MPAIAGVSQMINFQGRLTDEEDTALDDTLSIIFSIYTDATDGTQLWTETNGSVIVSKGIFNVLLGSINHIPDTVFTGPERWLGMRVEPDVEDMTPRKPIVSVGYAFHSATSDTAEHAHIATSDGDWEPSGDDIYREEGNVGIGTTAPTKKLTVKGDICIRDGGYLMFYRPGQAASYMILDGSGYFRYRPETLNDPFIIAPLAPSNTVFLANTGNVGIGTADPDEELHVVGNIKMVDGNQAAGKVLTSDAAGVGTWQAVNGGLVKVASSTFSNQASVTISGLSANKNYFLKMRVRHGSTQARYYMKFTAFTNILSMAHRTMVVQME